MTPIQFGFVMPADQLDKAQRTTYVADLNRALTLISGHFDSAWVIDHLQFGDADVLEGFTALAYMAALHPKLKFGHSVLCQSFRNPALLAKMSATLQFLSGGRGVVVASVLRRRRKRNASRESATVPMRTTLALSAHRCKWLSRCAPSSAWAWTISWLTAAGFEN